MPSRTVFTLTVSLLCLLARAWAADDAAPAAKRGPRAEEFYRLNTQMNALVGEFATLKLKYPTATEEQRTEIQEQWKGLIAKGDLLEPKLIAAAEQAYAEAPNADKQITDFLVTRQLARMVKRDDYEPAARIGKLLMDNKCNDKRLPLLAGAAAFAVSDYDAAQRYLEQAVANGGKLSTGCEYLDRLLDAFFNNPAPFKQSWAKEKAIRQAEAKADDLPRVLLKTSKGDITLELFENEAPNTVANFISLVQSGFYKDVTFHRVLAGFMAQGGDPTGNGSGGPGYSIACECHQPNHREHFRGTLSMAHAGRDTGGSQFFLTFVPTVPLNGMHTVFGRVIGGMDVLAKLQRYDPQGDSERPRLDKIIEAKVLRKRSHQYKPQKMPE